MTDKAKRIYIEGLAACNGPCRGCAACDSEEKAKLARETYRVHEICECCRQSSYHQSGGGRYKYWCRRRGDWVDMHGTCKAWEQA